MQTLNLHQLTLELIQAGQFLFQQGWVPATSGNFSARVNPQQLAITVSGRHKGRLTPADIMLIDPEGASLDGQTPSAETLLHTQIYRRFPGIHAVLHLHSINATLAHRLLGAPIVLENYELLKALDGITTHESRVVIPIFSNTQDMVKLAGQVDAYLDRHPDCYGYVIAGHGLYTWGANIAIALRQIEALEFLFACELRLQGAPR
ncbi:MAG: methylthioribulose 1-phosphate dehydratase [Methylococcales bacterium]|nr:methylthioribulose 1-phosphate dehydratase [Methylococcales bacterium]